MSSLSSTTFSHPPMPNIEAALAAPELESSLNILLESLKSGDTQSTDLSYTHVQQRLKELKFAQELRANRVGDEWSIGDNIEPIGRLSINDGDMWAYLNVAHFLKRFRKNSTCFLTRPTVAGLIAPAGGGKSTLVTVIKMLLEEVISNNDIRCAVISIDDFLTSGPANEGIQRQQYEIRTRWDCHATDVDVGCKILDKLMKLGKGGGDGSDSKVQVPCFQLSTDTQRLSNEKNINGPIDILLFEGWRVGIDHPNFFDFNNYVDTLVYLESDFEAILSFKLEKIKRDMATNGGYDLYNMVGRKYKYPNTLDDIFNNHYFAVAEKYILPCRGVSDVILRKNEKHHIELLEFSTDFPWSARRRDFDSRVSETEIAVMALNGSVQCVNNVDSMSDIIMSSENDSDNNVVRVVDITRGWAAKWILELSNNSWIRAKVVVWNCIDKKKEMTTPIEILQQYLSIRGGKKLGKLPWDGIPRFATHIEVTLDKKDNNNENLQVHAKQSSVPLEDIPCPSILVLGGAVDGCCCRRNVLTHMHSLFPNSDLFVLHRHDGTL